MKTYGSLEQHSFDGQSLWCLKARPDVMIRLKRIFPRAAGRRVDALMLKDTPELAADLEWVTQRWPLDIKPKARPHLRRRADEHRATREHVETILAGQRLPGVEFREPAREPRDYQTAAADLTIATGRLLLTDDVGLGKSMSGLLVLRAPDALPALVVTLTHLPSQWMDELDKTFPDLRGHVLRGTTPYDPAKRRGSGGHDPDVLVCNYAKLAGWANHLSGRVRTVIFDEMQELRRSDSLKYDAARLIAEHAAYKVGLTATPVYNYGGEIHTVLQILAADELGSRDEFTREWGFGMRGGHVGVREPGALGLYLREQGLMLRRTRKDVARELPDVLRVPHNVETDRDTLDRLVDGAVDLAELIVDATTDRRERFVASGDFDWRMRHATGVAKASYVAEFVKLLLETEERIVLFGWHRDVYDTWTAALKQFDPVMYTGSESPAAKERSRKAFLEGDSRILIMSLRAGAGLDGLQEVAHVAVFGELDWSPGIHEQCVGRLHRDGQDEPVVAYFLVSEEGTDPLMAEVLDLKRRQSDPIRDPNLPAVMQQVNVADRVRRLAAETLERRHRRVHPDQTSMERSAA